MALVVERIEELPQMLASPRAIVLVSVPWSPWPGKSRDVLAALESRGEHWIPEVSLGFYDLWPEREKELNRWYEAMCQNYSPQFRLHGDGYGPIWWLADGMVLDCLTKPYERPLQSLQQHSAAMFRSEER